MIWRYTKKELLENIVVANKEKNEYRVALSPNNKITRYDDNDVSDIRYISIFVNTYPTIEQIINNLLSLQQEYHNSLEVKKFYINGKTYWFDSQKRNSLINSFNVQKNNGATVTTIWLNNTSIIITIDKAIKLIEKLENYSQTCYNVTQQHLTEINNLSTLEECLNYDITKNYPDVLNIITE